MGAFRTPAAMSHDHGDTIPLHPSSAQSDMDEIESLIHAAPSPATVLPARPPSPTRASIPVSSSPAPAPVPTKPPLPAASIPISVSVSPMPASVSVPIGADGFGPPPNTLTEPVWDTVKRDLARIVSNLKLVVFPDPYREDPGKALRDWDLWGPFFFIVFLGLTLSWSASVKKIWDMQTKDHLRTLSVFMRSKLLKNGAGVNDHDRGNSSEQKSDHGSEIPAPGPINKASVENNGNKDSGTKENHGGRGRDDHANNATSASGRSSAGNPAAAGDKGKGQMGSAPTSTPIGHPNSSLPSGHLPPPSNATAGLYYQAGNNIFRDVNENLFSDENPNSCSVM